MDSHRGRCVGALVLALWLGTAAGCVTQRKASEKVNRFEAATTPSATTRPVASARMEVDGGIRPFRRNALADRPAPSAADATTRPRITLRRPPEYTDAEREAIDRPRVASSRLRLLSPLVRSRDRAGADAEQPHLVIDFLDVGQGDCTLVTFPNGKRLMVDCGSVKNGPVSKIRPALLALLDSGNPVVDELVITHPDRDHYNRLEAVLEGVTVDRVTTVGNSGEFPEGQTDKWLENNFGGSRYRIIKADENTPLPPKAIADFGDARAEIVAANVDPDGSNSPNSRSVVLKISFGEFDCLLTGDATFETEEAIANRYAGDPDAIDVEVLKLGHHGSRVTSTSPDWPALVKPEVAVVSCGNQNTFGHPSDQVVNRVFPFTGDRTNHELTVREKGTDRVGTTFGTVEAVYSTEDSGNIRVISDGSSTFFVVEHAH